MRKIFLVFLVIICIQTIKAQKVDTIFYDSNWHGVATKSLANYMRLSYPSHDSINSNIVKDYLTTGELQSERIAIYIDKNDDNKSKWKGKFTTYYQSGSKKKEGYYNDSTQIVGDVQYYYKDGKSKSIITYKNGSPQKETDYNRNGSIQKEIDYYSNGNIKSSTSFLDGKINGIVYNYSEDGKTHTETEMGNGEPANNYITSVDESGNKSKYDVKTNQLLWDTPTPEDRKETNINGEEVIYYQMNDIILSASLSIEKEYGKYFSADIALTNNTNQTIDFDADKITSILFTYKKDTIQSPCKVLTQKQYIKIVKNKQNCNSFFKGLGEGFLMLFFGVFVISDASIASTNPNYTPLMVNDIGNQSQNISNSEQQIAGYDNNLVEMREDIKGNYLISSKIAPSETIRGVVNIKYKSGNKFLLYIPINGVVYPFEWNVKK
jgi:antitoxin component YwqK of YwqJK toxin-antitoxin module